MNEFSHDWFYYFRFSLFFVINRHSRDPWKKTVEMFVQVSKRVVCQKNEQNAIVLMFHVWIVHGNETTLTMQMRYFVQDTIRVATKPACNIHIHVLIMLKCINIFKPTHNWRWYDVIYKDKKTRFLCLVQ